jgi:hypothetical protein
VRKLMPIGGLLGLVLVPAALAATQGPSAPSRHDKLITATLLDRHSLRRAAHHHTQAERRARKRRQRAAAETVSVPPQLQAIANCESGGDPHAVGGGGQFRGKYQFTTSTWSAVGGSGDPAAAPEAEQDRRAAMLYARSGPGQWPVCGS